MSSEISTPQPVASSASSRADREPLRADSSSFVVFGNGGLPASPFWLTCLKQPSPAVHAGRAEFFVVGFQIRFGGRIVVRIDQRHRLRGHCAGRQVIGGVQVLRSQTKRPRARRRRGQRRAAREPERMLASTSRSGSRHELQCQAPGAPRSGPRAHRAHAVVRARQRRDAARGHAREAEQSKHRRDHEWTKRCCAADARPHRSVRAVIRSPCVRTHAHRVTLAKTTESRPARCSSTRDQSLRGRAAPPVRRRSHRAGGRRTGRW